MKGFEYKRASQDSELEGILELQKANLPEFLSAEEIKSQGFLTVKHSFDILKKLNEIQPAIICKKEQIVVAYILAMTVGSRDELPILQDMFQKFEEVIYKDQAISKYRYIVIGQVCVKKEFRSQGVLEACYDLYRKSFKDEYDFAITLISNRNTRSLQAHKKVGFKTIHSYTSKGGELWKIVVLDW